MRIRKELLLLLALPAVPNLAAESLSLVDSLAQQLRTMRALPAGAATHVKCPSDTHSLIGVSQKQLTDNLGQPDYIEKPTQLWSYFLTSPIQSDQRGGGFPQITFSFGQDRNVTHVTCSYAR